MNSENKEKAIGAGLGILGNPAFQWLTVILLIFAVLWVFWKQFAAWWDKTFNSKTENGATGVFAHVANAFGFATGTGKPLPDNVVLNQTGTPVLATLQTGDVGSGTVLAPGVTDNPQETASVTSTMPWGFDPTGAAQ